MRHFAEEFERQLTVSNQSVDDIVSKTKLSRAQLYLWKRGEQTSINEAQITELARALSSDLADQASLLRAHLLDENVGPGSDLIQIGIDHPSMLKDRPKPRSKGEKALHFLAEERLRNGDLNELLIDLAKVLGAEL